MRKVFITVTMTTFLLSTIIFAATKQVSFINQSKCAHCGTCQKTCPVKAISKVEEGKMVKFVVDPKKCLGCGACVKACPTKSISFVDPSAVKVTPTSTNAAIDTANVKSEKPQPQDAGK
jgi:MinD superfamily P-loop ATPase